MYGAFARQENRCEGFPSFLAEICISHMAVSARTPYRYKFYIPPIIFNSGAITQNSPRLCPFQHCKHRRTQPNAQALKSPSVRWCLLVKNPAEGIRLPVDKRGKHKIKPHVTPEQFNQSVELIPEPYATMVFAAVWTGLRVSELIGLRWEDVGADSLTVDERYCRGDWDAPKSEASNATIGVERCTIERINRLK